MSFVGSLGKPSLEETFSISDQSESVIASDPSSHKKATKRFSQSLITSSNWIVIDFSASRPDEAKDNGVRGEELNDVQEMDDDSPPTNNQVPGN